MISQRYRFHGHSSLKYTFNHGQQARGRVLSIKFVDNERRRHPRIAVVISKKVLKHAVDRNRARRRIYEIMRGYLPKFNHTVDVAVIIYQDKVLTIPHPELVAEINKCLTKLDIIK